LLKQEIQTGAFPASAADAIGKTASLIPGHRQRPEDSFEINDRILPTVKSLEHRRGHPASQPLEHAGNRGPWPRKTLRIGDLDGKTADPHRFFRASNGEYVL